MALRCAILDDYQNVALKLADWSALGDKVALTVFDAPFADAATAIAALQDFDIVCAMRERTPFTGEVLSALPKLKLLLTSGMRNASFDLATARARNVTVCGTGNIGNPTVGIAIGLMLELTRRIGFENARMKAGAPWQITVGEDVEGKTLGIVGLGKLGARVAAVGLALGMQVKAWSSNLTPEACAAAGVAYASKEELFATSDVITIHLVLSERSRGLVGAADLARMKPSAYLINTARGPIVDEAALLAALRERRIAGAGLDTFWQEPLALDHPLRRLDNVVLTPHLGYVTAENYRRYYEDMVEDIVAWLAGAPVRQLG
ncbi:D-2-hydroxyacid dehydrogenase family protein [Bradyrhizobium sp. U87765 SZCCT0131]|uniref:D-2-hydroxyacid dehydrogenase family protein n=1 Tax=unclassified Bradyrhizobium TaxID=2631580 RepID=UPI001BA89B8F|nr:MULTISPECIES: D-2-hydroxyacid dehydrogenase family protein [unclassified Bradyrhizobium]MBR1218448.1 D-2-hydroxyacid dehydrogenase family protein [Bradyrhizobium sp. U87765 SZCCT0131]MBR1260606.1 D-2-hydroxyacid dehydrogenase family protein [Bradyrhizobium sp. U87765 SZCCT0134]MBR1303946.1 D-2-hydroxyacid dehydrogenase family protein [Bradyrhizobium sp. U87765 SZCCT0110]MBR1319552.1 D-2-hydroxyacid dehydrogenase family protein [Bradyrhizobium sp. U87765 SZCCT0109]MBR1347877.1 D-2-hydroxyaci